MGIFPKGNSLTYTCHSFQVIYLDVPHLLFSMHVGSQLPASELIIADVVCSTLFNVTAFAFQCDGK